MFIPQHHQDIQDQLQGKVIMEVLLHPERMMKVVVAVAALLLPEVLETQTTLLRGLDMLDLVEMDHHLPSQGQIQPMLVVEVVEL